MQSWDQAMISTLYNIWVSSAKINQTHNLLCFTHQKMQWLDQMVKWPKVQMDLTHAGKSPKFNHNDLKPISTGVFGFYLLGGGDFSGCLWAICHFRKVRQHQTIFSVPEKNVIFWGSKVLFPFLHSKWGKVTSLLLAFCLPIGVGQRVGRWKSIVEPD